MPNKPFILMQEISQNRPRNKEYLNIFKMAVMDAAIL